MVSKLNAVGHCEVRFTAQRSVGCTLVSLALRVLPHKKEYLSSKRRKERDKRKRRLLTPAEDVDVFARIANTALTVPFIVVPTCGAVWASAIYGTHMCTRLCLSSGGDDEAFVPVVVVVHSVCMDISSVTLLKTFPLTTHLACSVPRKGIAHVCCGSAMLFQALPLTLFCSPVRITLGLGTARELFRLLDVLFRDKVRRTPETQRTCSRQHYFTRNLCNCFRRTLDTQRTGLFLSYHV